MQEVVSFSDTAVWTWLCQLFIIAIALVVAMLLRRYVRPLRRSLVPTALVAGVLVLCCKAVPAFHAQVHKGVMEVLTYHCLGLGFTALSLKRVAGSQGRGRSRKVVETGVVTASTYLVQGIVGLMITVPMFLLRCGADVFYASGLLLPMGYGQGPGQALNMGKIFASCAAEQGLLFHGADFGLSIAAIGFLVGSLIGVVYMNRLRRQGRLQVRRIPATAEPTSSPEKAAMAGGWGSALTRCVCLILCVYAGVYAFMWGLQQVDMGAFGEKTVKPLVWGFNFLWGTLLATVMRVVAGKVHLLPPPSEAGADNGVLDAISTLCFDVMIVAGTAAISFQGLRAFWLPLLLVCGVGAVATFVYLRWVCAHLYPGYTHEAFFSMFGMLTGTVSNGMILLHEIDPTYTTPAANNLVYQSIPAIAFGLPVLLLMGFAPLSLTNTCITFGVLILIWLLFNLFLFRKRLFRRRKTA